MKRIAWIGIAVVLLAAAASAQQAAAPKRPRQDSEEKGRKELQKPQDREEERECCGMGPHYLSAYSHHIDKGEWEIMLSIDYTDPSRIHRERDGQQPYFSEMLMIEYAPTSQLTFELMLEGHEDVGTGEREFTGFRLEGRYKLFEQDVPLNPSIYFEYEDLDPLTRYKMEVSGWVEAPYEEEGAEEEETRRERVLESRLILSQDFGRWNVAFNWINETDLSGGDTAFGYMLAVACRFDSSEGFFRARSVTIEFMGALGDTRDFGLRPQLQEHYLQPGFAFHLGRLMVTLAYAVGLTDDSDNMARIMVGVEF